MKYSLDTTLYLVTDSSLAGGRPLEEVVSEAVRGGVTIVQLREKHLSTKGIIEKAFRIKEITDRAGIPLIVNDRLDVALACGAAGVHLGQDDMDCRLARRIAARAAGEDFIIGVSVSTVAEALQAEADGADYLGVSPVFSTPTKTDTPAATGLEGLRQIRQAVRLPLVAIGGINSFNAAMVIQAGADGVAVVSAIMASLDPCMAAATLMAAIEQGRRA